VAQGALAPDKAQERVMRVLSDIATAVEARAPKGLGRLLRAPAPVRGAYVWGPVGRGKTLLMDLFHSSVQTGRKRRVHFHAFMDEVHAAIGAFRAETPGKRGARDPILAVVRGIARQTDLLCLDEFHVTDITNAMLLQRLFGRLFAEGVTLVATSNTPPDRLYEHGLNRQLFLPFIDLLKSHCTILELEADKDYRRDRFSGEEVFHIGAGREAVLAMDRMWERLTGGQAPEPAVVRSLGRDIAVKRQALGVARFDFGELCEQPLGARDYLRLALAYHTFIIDGVPCFERGDGNAMRRFILLVDTLYDRGVKLAASLAAPPDQLATDPRAARELERSASRLIEMQSDSYLNAPLKAVADG